MKNIAYYSTVRLYGGSLQACKIAVPSLTLCEPSGMLFSLGIR
jgi:hypothetical protein